MRTPKTREELQLEIQHLQNDNYSLLTIIGKAETEQRIIHNGIAEAFTLVNMVAKAGNLERENKGVRIAKALMDLVNLAREHISQRTFDSCTINALGDRAAITEQETDRLTLEVAELNDKLAFLMND